MMTLNDNRSALQWTLGILAAIPMVSALGEILHGARGVPGGSPDVVPTVDSSLRYANVFKFAAGVTILRELGRIERSSATRFALSTIAVGGLARIAAWRQSGRPHPAVVGAIALETIGAPLLMTWQRRLSAKEL
ncbi:MAG: DUF4345 domain-containing protein [Candidatus Nanopelagicales bacterium]